MENPSLKNHHQQQKVKGKRRRTCTKPQTKHKNQVTFIHFLCIIQVLTTILNGYYRSGVMSNDDNVNCHFLSSSSNTILMVDVFFHSHLNFHVYRFSIVVVHLSILERCRLTLIFSLLPFFCIFRVRAVYLPFFASFQPGSIDTIIIWRMMCVSKFQMPNPMQKEERTKFTCSRVRRCSIDNSVTSQLNYLNTFSFCPF